MGCPGVDVETITELDRFFKQTSGSHHSPPSLLVKPFFQIENGLIQVHGEPVSHAPLGMNSLSLFIYLGSTREGPTSNIVPHPVP